VARKQQSSGSTRQVIVMIVLSWLLSCRHESKNSISYPATKKSMLDVTGIRADYTTVFFPVY